jgi:hypothetical protein
MRRYVVSNGELFGGMEFQIARVSKGGEKHCNMMAPILFFLFSRASSYIKLQAGFVFARFVT